MLIIACDGGCGRQSPDSEGRRIGDHWLNITIQRQADRTTHGAEKAGSRRLTLCESCWPRFNNEAVEKPIMVVM